MPTNRRGRPERPLAPGPHKKRLQGGPVPRLSSHKQRSVWFRARAAWPYREADGDHLVAQRAKVGAETTSVPADRMWEGMGPTNIGGRCTSLVVHPADPEILWIGAAGGGVWKSTDGGATWVSLWHKQDSLNVGSLALDPEDPNIIYCGTGEANLSADSYPGVGIYRSADGGKTWTLWAPAREHRLPRRIGVIAIDPFDPSHIRVGGVTHADGGPCGMYVTRDGGATWRRENFVSSFGYFCHSIVFHPRKPGVILAGVSERGMQGGTWRSTDGGATWTHATSGLPSPELLRRVSLAIAPSQPDTVYALAANDREGVLGVFVSRNMGTSWKSIGGTHFRDEGQMSYNNTIAVHPADARHVLCGGVDLHRTRDGGKTWRRVTFWDANRGAPDYAHADHHCLVMPANAPGRVYDANDGGMDRSDDGGRTWRNCSAGLAVTMYYDLDVAPSDARSFGGGTQDNGTVVTTGGDPGRHFEILGGDGGWMVYHPRDAVRLFASYYGFHIYRFRGTQPPKNVSPPAPPSERASVWMCYITLHPKTPTTVFTGSFRVWRTKTAGDTWTPVSASLDDSPITAIEVAPANPRFVYVGTENGGLFRTRDGGRTWSGNIAGAQMSGRTITRIETHPVRGDTVFVTTAGTGRSHVFRSTDGGASWTDIDRGRLPDVPHHAVVVPPDDPNALYVTGDAGVYATADGGTTWTNLSRNLPNAMVVDAVYHQGEGALYVATYGRSIWRLRVG